MNDDAHSDIESGDCDEAGIVLHPKDIHWLLITVAHRRAEAATARARADHSFC